jgi:hypothetical protein
MGKPRCQLKGAADLRQRGSREWNGWGACMEKVRSAPMAATQLGG